ncbi:MAG: hypothetical protein KF773_38780 [Deltaproteobacteria bacterium]|nr:hypothetical protein [Deltaproteobacteria bacterium]MCW5804282.1 hypothetical protein [Deltaproteobacteria bacterium]
MKASAYALTALPTTPTLTLPTPSAAVTARWARPAETSPAERQSFPAMSDERGWFCDTGAFDTAPHHLDRDPLERPTVPLVLARAPRARAAMLLALAVVLAPMVAPLCWRFAEDELRAITSGAARGESGARGLQLAAMWGAFVTFLGIGFMLAYPVGLLLL